MSILARICFDNWFVFVCGSEAYTKWIELFGIAHILIYDKCICVSFIVSHYLISSPFFLQFFFSYWSNCCHFSIYTRLVWSDSRSWWIYWWKTHFCKLNFIYLAADVILSYAKLVYITMQHKLQLVFGIDWNAARIVCYQYTAPLGERWLHWHISFLCLGPFGFWLRLWFFFFCLILIFS